MDSLSKLQNKITLILEGILPTFLFDMYNDAMMNMDEQVSKIWETGLSYLQTSILGAGSLAFALGSPVLSLLMILQHI